jgi:transcriptional regulator with XRE-family HTH domain
MDELSNVRATPVSEIVRALGSRFKEYRLAARLTQKEVADQSGVSLLTIRRFELGYSYNITMGNFIALLKAIDFTEGLGDVLPEIPVSPYALAKLEGKKPKRVRHGKQS